MIDTVPRPDANLPELLAARARHASDARLALDAVVGFLFLVAALLWHGPGWHLAASVAGCFFAFGLWGISDRELGERAPGASMATLRLLRVTRVVAAVLGAVAVVVVLFSALGIAFGRMIS